MFNNLITVSEGDPRVAGDERDVVAHKTITDDTGSQRRQATPTAQAYGELQFAYDYFNEVQFNGKLPQCLITLQRKADRVLGYFHGDRFGQRERAGSTVDEIAMNPRHFQKRTVEETLSTLVHEMVHLWQHHYGTPSRVGYHNAEWSMMMKMVGLQPTHNGQPDGRVTGQSMTHLIIADGPFDRAAKALVSEQFRLSWYDRLTEMSATATGGDGGSDGTAEPGKRAKFTCPRCDANAWGKPTLKISCGDCQTPMPRS